MHSGIHWPDIVFAEDRIEPGGVRKLMNLLFER